MSKFWTPKGKASRTKAAKVLDAWGHDLILAGGALRQAAVAMTHENNTDQQAGEGAWICTKGAIELISMVFISIQSKGTRK